MAVNPAPSPLQVQEIFKRFSHRNPSPVGELYYINPFTLLVAVVLSAQSTDAGVNRVTKELFKFIQTPEDMLAWGEERLKESIKTIGLYKTKAHHLINLARRIKEAFQGQVPSNLTDLISLPGVGQKTANVVLNTVFDHPTIAVDTHVFRVAHRLGLTTGVNPLKVEADLLEIIPEKYLKYAHLWLILHGRYICKARSPQCEKCFLMDICPFYQALSADSALFKKV